MAHSATAREARVCGNCLASGRSKDLMLCQGCRMHFFCNADCLRTAWKQGHKEICKAHQETAATSSPAQNELNEAVTRWLKHANVILRPAIMRALHISEGSPGPPINKTHHLLLVVERMRNATTHTGRFKLVNAVVAQIPPNVLEALQRQAQGPNGPTMRRQVQMSVSALPKEGSIRGTINYGFHWVQPPFVSLYPYSADWLSELRQELEDPGADDWINELTESAQEGMRQRGEL